MRCTWMSTARLCAGGLCLLLGSAQAALPDDWTLSVDAQYRVRGMSDTGLDFVDDDARHNISHRARLGALLAGPSGLEFRLLLQDVRFWGEARNTLNDFSADGLDVREAWVANHWGDFTSLRLGRQNLSLDDQRIIGAVDWTQRGRAFDGAVLKYAAKTLSVQAFGFRLVESDARGGDGHITDPTVAESDMAGLHVHADFHEGLTASALLMHVFIDDFARSTAGVYLSGKAAGLDYSAAYYFQASEVAGEAGTSQLIATRVGYALDVAGSPGAHVWFDRLDSDGTPEGSFATPFATNHKFYGYMDRFIDTVGDPLGLGLVDAGGGLVATPTKGLKTGADAHLFQSVEDGPDGARAFGTEVDVHLKWSISKQQSLVAVYGVFLPGDLTEATAGEEPEHLGFVTFNTQL